MTAAVMLDLRVFAHDNPNGVSGLAATFGFSTRHAFSYCADLC